MRGKSIFGKSVEQIFVQKLHSKCSAQAKPAGSKGTYVQRVAVSSTMGPGVKVEPGSLTF